MPFLLAIVLTLSACALLPRGDRTSVETVLGQTVSVGEQLDTQAREAAEEQGRTLASRIHPKLQQPLRKVAVNSPFGKRDGSRHDGLDLKAPIGTPVYAAADGIVVFAGDAIDGYGDMVMIRHAGDITTLYAHASALRVQVGDTITKGQCIAYSGDTGNATGPHLHFEVRDGHKAVNPWPWIFPAQRKVSSKGAGVED